MKKFFPLFFFLIVLGSCTNKPANVSSENSDTLTNDQVIQVAKKDSLKTSDSLINALTARNNASNNPIKKDSVKPNPNGFRNVFYQPHEIVLTGTLKLEMFYGPLNFGDDPKHDQKEWVYILDLDKKINVLVSPDDDASIFHDFDAPIEGVKKIELFFDDSALNPFLNQKITLKGTLVGRSVGSQFTEVLMNVIKIIK